MSDARVFVNGRALEVPTGRHVAGDGPRVIVRLVGPVGSGWAGRLERIGARVAFWCPPYGACVTLRDAAAAEALAASDLVAGFVPYDEGACDRDLGAPTPLGWLDVVCFSSTDRPRVAAALRSLGAAVLDESGSKLRIEWSGDLAPVRDVVGVKLVERPRLPHVSAAGLAADVDFALASGAWRADLDGTGELVAVADTGLDTGDTTTLTPDLAGRVRSLRSWPINPSWSPYVTNPGADDGAADLGSGHGTYVAGLAVGSGARSGGTRRGVAPGADLVFAAIEQWVAVAPGHAELGPSTYTLAGRPTDLRSLLQQSYDLGARLQVFAWGTSAGGAYDNDAYEADLFLSEHRESLLLVAAGNEGSDRDGDRETDPGSLDSPATAKNALTIGATEGSEPNGYPYTWQRLQSEGRIFANAADRSDALYGEPDRVAPLSSAGPTADGRTKPDLCAPGTCLVGPRAALATGRGWGLADPVPHYLVDGGTSAAVAVAGGAAALIRQAWRRELGRTKPAGATLKALAIVGAAPVLTRDGTGPESRRIAGYGRLDVDASLPRPSDGSTVSVLVNATKRAGVRTGQTRRHRVTVPPSGRLRAVLTWYDVPGERLVNDLDLTLTGPGTTVPVRGNHQTGDPQEPGAPDRTNTVEVVDVAGLAGGTWELAVTGENVPQGPQPYALVVRIWT